MNRDPITGRMLPRKIEPGERYGRLVVVGRQSGKNVLCRCDCGNEKTVTVSNLRHSDPKRTVRSCGCLAREYQTAAKTSGLYVGGKKHPMRIVYDGMKNRCLNPRQPSYPAYGGRGIRICDRWLGPNGFENFWVDMGDRPGKEFSLDRIDTNGNYEPSNCRWATRETQTANRRPFTLITVAELERLRAIEAAYLQR